MADVTLEALGLDTLDSGEVITDIAKASAFQQATERINILPGKTTEAVHIKNFASVIVPEGGAKELSGENAILKVTAQKFVAANAQTWETWLSANYVVDAIGKVLPQNFGADFDNYVAGVKALPAGTENFGVLGAAFSVEVSNYANIATAINHIESGDATAFVLSTKFYNYLAGLTTTLGTPLFPELVAGGTLRGLPVYTFKSTASVGFVGDFSRARYGAKEDIELRVANEGTIDGVNLLETNKVALIAEAFYGFNFLDLDDFVKLVVDATP